LWFASHATFNLSEKNQPEIGFESGCFQLKGAVVAVVVAVVVVDDFIDHFPARAQIPMPSDLGIMHEVPK